MEREKLELEKIIGTSKDRIQEADKLQNVSNFEFRKL